MFCGPELFERYSRLKELGLELELEAGSRVARGFADLGFEEFVVLPARKLLSLFRGTLAEIVDDEIEDLIFLPDSEQMIKILQEKGCRLENLCFEDQRRWKLELEKGDGAHLFFEERTLELVLISALQSVLLKNDS
jgi:hypothetical protein